jgi:hypothetical protein
VKTRREFLQLLFETGAVTAAGLYLPYVPKRIYSFAPPPEPRRQLVFVTFEGIPLQAFNRAQGGYFMSEEAARELRRLFAFGPFK